MRAITRAHGPSPRTFFTARVFCALAIGYSVFAFGQFWADGDQSDALPATHAERAYVSSGLWGTTIQHATSQFLRLDYAGGYQLSQLGRVVVRLADSLPSSLRSVLVAVAIVAAMATMAYSLMKVLPLKTRLIRLLSVAGLILLALMIRFPVPFVHAGDVAASLPARCTLSMTGSGAAQAAQSNLCDTSLARHRLTSMVSESAEYHQHHQSIAGRALNLAVLAEVALITAIQLGGQGLILLALLASGILLVAVCQARLRYYVMIIVRAVAGAVALITALSLLQAASLTMLERRVYAAPPATDASVEGLLIVAATLAVMLMIMLLAASATRRWLE